MAFSVDTLESQIGSAKGLAMYEGNGGILSASPKASQIADYFSQAFTGVNLGQAQQIASTVANAIEDVPFDLGAVERTAKNAAATITQGAHISGSELGNLNAPRTGDMGFGKDGIGGLKL